MISTHVLDTGKGVPAKNISITLQSHGNAGWQMIEKGTTNEDGRLVFNSELKPGNYQLLFHVESYLKQNTKDYFYTEIPVSFKIEDTKRKYHIPLLLNPFGYSTYRGS